jgi:thiosulfate/3-mercaptopyruvate sulfurtransferase
MLNAVSVSCLRALCGAWLLLGLPVAQMFAQPASRAESVVTTTWVKALLDYQNGAGPRPPGYRNERFVILETSWAKLAAAKDYRAGHLPGAVHLNTDELENGYPRWLLRPVADLQRVIGAHGITPDTTVIVYGKPIIAAARAWWILSYAGVADVRLLDGGLAAWQAAGYPLETNIQQPQPMTFMAKPRDAWLATTAYVRKHPRALRADARSHAEFIGEKSGYAYLDFKGRLPRAVHIGDADDAARLYVNADGSLRDLNEVRALWEQAGIRDDKREVIFYCGSGWRSSLAFLYARQLGFERIRNYSDGWVGWSTVYRRDQRAQGSTPGWRQQRTRNPIATGVGRN